MEIGIYITTPQSISTAQLTHFPISLFYIEIKHLEVLRMEELPPAMEFSCEYIE
jgi:hypothetical protein